VSAVQNQITMVAPVIAQRRQELTAWLDQEVGYQGAGGQYHELLQKIPDLHFISMFALSIPRGDDKSQGYLVLEASFDGPASDFIAAFVLCFGTQFQYIMSLCEQKPNEAPADFILRYRRAVDCFYVSCPGISRKQAEEERKLFEFLRARVDGIVASGRGGYPNHDKVIDTLRRDAEHEKYLKDPAPKQPFLVRTAEILVRMAFVLVAMAIMALYVFVLGPWPPLESVTSQPFFLAAIGLGVLAGTRLLVKSGSGILVTAAILLALLAGMAGIAAISRIIPSDTFMFLRYALFALVMIVGAVALWLYRIELLERVDRIDTGWIDIAHMRDVCRAENTPGCMQNHFVNVSAIKPGRLRYWSLRIVLRLIHFAGVVYFNRGKLGGIPSIHFARWFVLDEKTYGTPLLVFLTNYDGSWDSYLGDFVDDSSVGVSGIWSNTGGFPRTWGLVFGGGSRFEKQFKAYARQGQQRTQAWFSAYPNLSVRQKRSNAHIRRLLLKANRLTVTEKADLLQRL